MRLQTGKDIALLLVLSVVITMPAVAQAQRKVAFAANAAVERDRNTTESGVFVRDSAIAADKFELGKRMERLKEWHKSADVYNEILEKYQDRVVPTAMNDHDQPIKFQSVAVAVQERLARWPEDGLTVYRTRFEPIAASLLDQTKRDDYATLHKILGQYFVTDSAKLAGIRLIDLYLEAGDFSAASWIGDRLLTMHPNLGNDRAGVLFRTALAHHLSGNMNLATRRFDELKNKFPAEKTTVAGKEMLMVDALTTQLASKPPKAVGSAEDSYRTIGGDETRNLIGNAAGRPGARIYSIPLPAIGSGSLRSDRSKDEDIWINIIPAVDRGELVFQDGQRVYAVHLESGMPLPGWQQTYPDPDPQRTARYQLPSNTAPGAGDFSMTLRQMPQQFSVMLTDDSVLAVMGLPVISNTGMGITTATGTRLVCLDRANGRLKWMADPNALPNNAGGARNLNYSGSPLVVGDNVYVMVRGSTGGGVEDCHVACYDLQKGSFNWMSYIASAQTIAPNMGGMPMAAGVRPDTLSHLAFASGRVFVMTNLGAVAAIDAYSGTTLWLSLYPRDQSRILKYSGNRFGGMPTPTSSADMPKAWEFNPIIVQDGRVFALPTDGTDLIVYDSGNGDAIRGIPREIDVGDRSSKRTYRLANLLGVIGERVVLTGRASDLCGTFCLDWTKYAAQADDSRLDLKATFWVSTSPPILGRPFVTRDCVVVPTQTALSSIDMATGKIRPNGRYPRGGAPWPDDEGPGNVLVTREHVIVANARNISVYTDLEGVRQKYDLAIRNNPADVDTRMVFAEMMFNARELDDARKALDDAITVLGGMQAMRAGAQRDRIFTDAILFAQKLAADKNSKVIGIIYELYDRAAAAANTPSQQVNYRFSRANFIETSKSAGADADVAMAARLYQEVISDAQMRIIMLSAGESGSIQAGRSAEDAITKLISKYGAACYKQFEDQAAQKLTELSANGTPDQLLTLAENYPNAVSVASQSMMLAAEAYEKSGNIRMASQVLRRIYWKYPTRATAEKGKLVEAMARDYLKLGNVGAALGRMQRFVAVSGDWKLSSPLLMADGTALGKRDGKPVQTFKEALDVLQQLGMMRESAKLPDVRLPRYVGSPRPKPFQPEDDKLNIAGVQAIVETPLEIPAGTRYDRVMLWSGGRLICLVPGQPKALWSSDALTEPALGIAWRGKNLLAWSEGQVALIDGETGKSLWKVELLALPTVELVAGGSGEPPKAAPPPPEMTREDLMLLQRRELLQRRRGAIAPAVALPVEQPKPQPAPADGIERFAHVRSLADRVIVSTSTGRLCAIDISNGQLFWQTRLSASRSIQQVLSNDEFTAIRLLTESNTAQLIVLDAFNGQQIFRRTFTPGSNNWAMNCILSPDGTLVWTAPQEVAAKDLYEPGDDPTWTKTAQGRSYSGMILSDQLALWGQQVLILCDGGRMIERRWLRNGDQTGELLNTIASSTSSSEPPDTSTMRLRVSGRRVFAISSGSGISYDLETGVSTPYTKTRDTTAMPGEMTLSSDYVIIPGKAQGDRVGYIIDAHSRAFVPSPLQLAAAYRLLADCYGRSFSPSVLKPDPGRGPENWPGKGNESGRYDYGFIFAPAEPIKAWSIVEGGVYYLSGDKLHWLRGNRQ